MEYYDRIIKTYEKRKFPTKFIDIWCGKFILELLKENTKPNIGLIQKNCLILLINLFYKKEPDLYNRSGVCSQVLDKNKKNRFITILKSEFE
ncbi:MAG: hypothetical protein GF383_14120 [Candidatus Lokiarchaeota archaeon]|nr:hypothetical protein [Candidatus Lokiarchaeota archaeon]MBD3342476.1 hypothetical protein [Candidatus Lokiarchaeota archaeon]